MKWFRNPKEQYARVDVRIADIAMANWDSDRMLKK